MKTSLLSLGSFLLTGLSASAQWVNQAAPLPATSLIHSNVVVVDANTVWTTDLQTGSTAGTGRQLSAYFSRTTNGGAAWTTLPVAGLALDEYSITSLHALDASTAWITVSTPRNSGGRVLKTTDGGQTWTTQISVADVTPHWVRFLNANTGIAVCKANGQVGEFKIYTSRDGGTSWGLVPATTLPSALTGEMPYTVSLGIRPVVTHFGSSLWFGTSKGRVFRTPDGGQTWTVSTGGASTAEVRNIQFRDERNGLMQSAGDVLSRTTDGGVTWSAITPMGPMHTIGLANVPGTNTYVSTGYSGTFNGRGSSVSADDGRTWTALESTTEHAFVDFASATVGWSSGVVPAASSFQNGGMNRFNATVVLSSRRTALASNVFVYPNPSATGQFKVQVAERVQRLRVLDAAGRVTLDTAAPAAAPDGSLPVDLSQARAGFYTLQIQTPTGLTQQKLIVQ